MSEHDKVLTGIVESFGSGEDGYQDVTGDDFSKDSNETLRGILHAMIGKRVLITVDEYPTTDVTT